jgi:membrane-associated phospholipid phosphatase
MRIAAAVAAAVFVAFPTRLERHVPHVDGFTGMAWAMLYAADIPFNCFPSLHVALAGVAGAALWRRGWRALALVWPGLIVVSTLTTRQHVGWDIAAGAALAAAAWTVTPRLVRHG